MGALQPRQQHRGWRARPLRDHEVGERPEDDRHGRVDAPGTQRLREDEVGELERAQRPRGVQEPITQQHEAHDREPDRLEPARLLVPLELREPEAERHREERHGRQGAEPDPTREERARRVGPGEPDDDEDAREPHRVRRAGRHARDVRDRERKDDRPRPRPVQHLLEERLEGRQGLRLDDPAGEQDVRQGLARPIRARPEPLEQRGEVLEAALPEQVNGDRGAEEGAPSQDREERQALGPGAVEPMPPRQRRGDGDGAEGHERAGERAVREDTERRAPEPEDPGGEPQRAADGRGDRDREQAVRGGGREHRRGVAREERGGEPRRWQGQHRERRPARLALADEESDREVQEDHREGAGHDAAEAGGEGRGPGEPDRRRDERRAQERAARRLLDAGVVGLRVDAGPPRRQGAGRLGGLGLPRIPEPRSPEPRSGQDERHPEEQRGDGRAGAPHRAARRAAFLHGRAR